MSCVPYFTTRPLVFLIYAQFIGGGIFSWSNTADICICGHHLIHGAEFHATALFVVAVHAVHGQLVLKFSETADELVDAYDETTASSVIRKYHYRDDLSVHFLYIYSI